MLGERTTEGLEVRLRPRGIGRFVTAAFLSVWLCGWTAGEGFALYMLYGMARAFVTGDPQAAKKPKRLALAVETDVGVLVVSDLGEPQEWTETLEALRRELAILANPDAQPADATSTSTSGPPDGWEEVVSPEGEPVLVQRMSTRRTQAGVMTGLALLAIVTAAMLIANATHNLSLIPGAVIVSAIAAGLTWGATWLMRGRMEWKIGSGTITLRRRFGATVRDEFVARSLELNMRSDSDGDDWFSLDARSTESPAAANVSMILVRLSTKDRRRIVQTLHDSTVPRRLGKWLSQRAGMPFEDLATEERRAAELAQLRTQLETFLPRIGPVGNLVRVLIERGEARRKV